MPYNDAHKRAVAKYNAKAYDEIKIRVPKGEKESIQAHAKKQGESVNGFVKRAKMKQWSETQRTIDIKR